MQPQPINVTLVISTEDLPRYIDAVKEGHASLRRDIACSDDDREIGRLTREANRLQELLDRLNDLNPT